MTAENLKANATVVTRRANMNEPKETYRQRKKRRNLEEYRHMEAELNADDDMAADAARAWKPSRADAKRML